MQHILKINKIACHSGERFLKCFFIPIANESIPHFKNVEKKINEENHLKLSANTENVLFLWSRSILVKQHSLVCNCSIVAYFRTISSKRWLIYPLFFLFVHVLFCMAHFHFSLGALWTLRFIELFSADIIPITQEGKQMQRKVNWIALLQQVSVLELQFGNDRSQVSTLI